MLSRDSVGSAESAPARLLRSAYAKSLPRVIRRPLPLFLAAALLLLAGGVALASMGTSTLPTLRESQVLIQSEAAPGTSLPEMDRLMARAAREVRALPGVTQVGGHVGRAVTADQIVGANSGELWATIGSDADYDGTLASIRNVMGGYPGIASHVEAFSTDKVRDSLAGAGSLAGARTSGIDVRLYGEELPVLERTAAKLAIALGKIDGVSHARVARQPSEPTIKVQVDIAAADRVGLMPGDVRRASATLLSGTVVGSLFEKQRVFDVVVWGTPDTRSNLSNIRNLQIGTPGGGHVRLSQVADVSIAPSPPVIERQAVSRLIDISVALDGRDRGAVAQDDQPRSADRRHCRSSTTRRSWEKTHSRQDGRSRSPLAALIVMLLLLQVWLGSWRLARACRCSRRASRWPAAPVGPDRRRHALPRLVARPLRGLRPRHAQRPSPGRPLSPARAGS